MSVPRPPGHAVLYHRDLPSRKSFFILRICSDVRPHNSAGPSSMTYGLLRTIGVEAMIIHFTGFGVSFVQQECKS